MKKKADLEKGPNEKQAYVYKDANLDKNPPNKKKKGRFRVIGLGL
jgi:hypothetical protein